MKNTKLLIILLILFSLPCYAQVIDEKEPSKYSIRLNIGLTNLTDANDVKSFIDKNIAPLSKDFLHTVISTYTVLTQGRTTDEQAFNTWTTELTKLKNDKESKMKKGTTILTFTRTYDIHGKYLGSTENKILEKESVLVIE